MAADVEERPDLALPIACDDQALGRCPAHEEVPGLADLADVADVQPLPLEHPLDLLLEEHRRGVVLAREAGEVPRLMNDGHR